jgi:serine/threonine protein kinase/tetratricopeptide (TPR) repeat protein
MNPERPNTYEQLSPEAAARVDAVCDGFEKAWKAARSGVGMPCLSNFLDDCEGPERTILAEELRVLDRACRERYGYAVRLGDSNALGATNPAPTIPSDGQGRRAVGTTGRPSIPGLELIEVIGSGGMGVVFKARQAKLDRAVAVKFLHEAHRADTESRDRFLQEARAIARLRHPHLVQVYEFGEAPAAGGTASQPYLVLEYVSGGSLADLLRGSPQPPKEAARLVETLADAVHYAHQQGVVHRDLKPANVLLVGNRESAAGSTESGNETWNSRLQTTHSLLPFPKITDFGLAKFSTGTNLTQTGDILGTPSYMAPEQTVGKSGVITAAVDVYGLGAILYEALTGRPPFQAETAIATVAQVRQDDPVSPRRLQPTVPRDLETICLKCLQKEPGRRYATAEDLADDLRRFQAGEPVRARPVGTGERVVRWCRRKPGVAGLLAALVLVFLVGSSGVLWQWHRARRERDIANQEKDRAERRLQMVHRQVDELNRLGRDLLERPGQYRTGKDVLEEALAFYKKMLPEDLNDPSIRLEAADLFGKVAYIYVDLGDAGKAVEAYDRQARLLTTLLEEEQDSKDLRRKLAFSHRWRGNALRDLGKTREAREGYDQAAALQEELLDECPEEARYKYALANTLLNTADLLSHRDQAQELKTLYCRILKLNRSAVGSAPDDPWLNAELALALMEQAEFLLDAGRGSDAEAAVREALEIHKRVLDSGQMKGTIERYVGRNCFVLGRVLAAAGKAEEAEQSYREAVNLLNRIVDELPESALRRTPLAEALAGLADFLKDAGRLQDAEEIRRRAIHHYETLKADFPENPVHRRNLVPNYLRLANLLYELGRQTEADESLRKALDLDPEEPAVNKQLAWFLATNPETRLRDASLALRLANKAVAAQPQASSYWTTRGVAHYRNGDDKAAVADLEKAISLRADGGDSLDWLFLSMAHQRLGDHDKAQTYFDQAVQWMEKHKPHDDELRRFRAEAEAGLADSRKH